MASPRFRRFARMLAAVLLVWMTADLVGHGLGVHDPHGLAPGHPVPVLTAGGPVPAAPAGVPHDCFCCFQVAEVGAPFGLPFVASPGWTLSSDGPGQPHSDSHPLYHPPLA